MQDVDSQAHAWPSAITDHQRSGVLEIEWPGGERSQLPHSFLRARCRCAACEQALRTQGSYPIPVLDIRLVEIRPVSDKGLNLVFSDGHQRGIYPWLYLRELGELSEQQVCHRF
jgi:DUF971 family protein